MAYAPSAELLRALTGRGPTRDALSRTALAGLVTACAVGFSMAVGYGIATSNPLVSLGLLALAAVALITVYLKLAPEVLFLGWIFAAPLVSHSARESAIGFPLYAALYVVPIGVFAVHLLRSHPLARPLRWFDALPGAYLALIVVSQAVVDAEAAKEPGFYTNLVHSGVLIGVAGYYFCAFGPIGRLSTARLASVLLASGGGIAALGLYEHYTFWNIWGQELVDFPPRIVVSLGQPGVLGAFLGTVVVLGTAVLVWDGPRRLRRPAMLAIALAAPALFFTYTRGAILPTVAVAAALVAAKPRARLVGAGVAVVVGVLLFLNWSSFSSSADYQRRDPTDLYNVSTRLLIASASLELARDRPLLGHGYGEFDDVKARLDFDTGALPQESVYGYTSHNTYLTILVELGIVGLALLLLPWIIVGFAALRDRDDGERWFTLGSLGSILVIALTALTTDMRYFSFVPALLFIHVGLLRRRMWDSDFLRRPAQP